MKSQESAERIESLIAEGFENGAYPSLVISVKKAGKEIFSYEKGKLNNNDPLSPDVSNRTLFDLASLTKPLATTIVALSVMEKEKISPESRVGSFIPEAAPQTSDVTLAHLFTHASGLPPIPEIFRLFPTPEDIDRDAGLRRLFSLEPQVPPGREVIYSCSGYILLKEIIERIAGEGLETLYEELVTTPCGLEGLMFTPLEKEGIIGNRDIAATEYCPWRDEVLQGKVHDENAYCFGGVGGNAGLFGNAVSIMKLIGLFSREGHIGDVRVLGPESLRLMTTCQTGEITPKRAFGFLTQDRDSFAGQGFSPLAFGHTGFTGTSVWIDPESRLEIVLLTNRVHLGRAKTAQKIIDFRRALHPLFLNLK